VADNKHGGILETGDCVVIIIGGGAGGLIAAIAAGSIIGGENVRILEKNDRVGRKILATGNGRCNLTNINASVSDYMGEHPEFCSYALRSFSPEKAINFFQRLGLVIKIEADGRAYPKCGMAGAVLDILRNEISRLNIEVIHAEAVNIRFAHSLFSVYSSKQREVFGQRVIIATGGRAAPVYGSDGGGYDLLIKFGHKLNAVYPALVQLRTGAADIKALNGIRVTAGISLVKDGDIIARQEGELQFTNYGVSGIPALNLSGMAGQGSDIVIDFSPDTDDSGLLRLLRKRSENLSHLDAGQYFTGFFHKTVGRILLKYAGIPFTMPVSRFTEKELIKLVTAIKSYTAPLSGVLGFNEAQATGGGIDTDGFDPHTMESYLIKGLYAAGEVLDIYGPCGGYNLQWAWASGYLAGKSAASDL